MFDGIDILRDTVEEKARYWSQIVGIDGFFLNFVMMDWQEPSPAKFWAEVAPGLLKGIAIGASPKESGIYTVTKHFQELYSHYGVAYNFIKTRSYRPLDWHDQSAQTRIIENFKDAAILARYTGLRGIAIDLEPTYDLWSRDPLVPDKRSRAIRLGNEIGLAIKFECSRCELIVLPEVVWDQEVFKSPAYYYAPDFWHGLLRAHPDNLIVATETTYDNWRPQKVLAAVRARYMQDIVGVGVDPSKLHFAPGIWPLGKTYTDKSARLGWSPKHLEEGLRAAMAEGVAYVWIYGHGSAWESNGAYSKGRVDPRFSEFTRAVHAAKTDCDN